MTESHDDAELIHFSADRFGVPADVLTALLALEDSFQNFSAFGAKAEFSRRIATILDNGSSKATKYDSQASRSRIFLPIWARVLSTSAAARTSGMSLLFRDGTGPGR